MKDSLGDRMKKYEDIPRINLTQRMPTIIRLDGKAFHTYTRGFTKPLSMDIVNAFTYACSKLSEIQGLKLIYVQSDEVSILLTDYDNFDTTAWFDKNVQKMASVSASLLTAHFNKFMWDNNITKKIALFDSRTFVLPKEEVCNYFVWRQADAIRNSVSCLAQANFSHKQLDKKNTADKKQMLKEKGISWEDTAILQQRGFCINKNATVDFNIPLFKEQRYYINNLVNIEAEQ